jgi:hypothetical protein
VTRSRIVGIVVVVLLAGASGAASAGDRTAAATTAAASTDSAVPGTSGLTAFDLPVMDVVSAPFFPPVVHQHKHTRHRDHHIAKPEPLPPCPGLTSSPHFATPGASMRYLARAWNRDDLDALCHVTDPEGRAMLRDMHSEAIHLRFGHCDSLGVGQYSCTFRHDYPRHLHASGHGRAFVMVAAARTPGWFMSGFVGCG